MFRIHLTAFDSVVPIILYWKYPKIVDNTDLIFGKILAIRYYVGSSATSALAEIREGAERLAMELDEYLSKSSNSKTSIFRVDGVSSTPIEAVADLQLATARKLREV